MGTIPIPYSYERNFINPTAVNCRPRHAAWRIPLFKTDPATHKQVLVGGIGVFFPGTTGYADFEQNFQFNNKKQTTLKPTNAPLALLAEWMAFGQGLEAA